VHDDRPQPPIEPRPVVPSAPGPAAQAAAAPARITIQQFLATQLRVARVVAAERVPDADRLLKLQVDLGTEQRQIVAGIARSYEPEALVGKKVVVVANLEPARIRGVESQGMLLAADFGGRPVIATFEEDVAPGTTVR
jgi:methionyl-tRNA synthetase